MSARSASCYGSCRSRDVIPDETRRTGFCKDDALEITMKAWLCLVVAGLLETAWAIGLKYTAGFTRPIPSVLTGAAIVASMWLLAVAARTLPIGTAYAVWVGIGATGAALVGTVVLHEPMPPARFGFVVLLILSIIGLKLTAPAIAPQ